MKRRLTAIVSVVIFMVAVAVAVLVYRQNPAVQDAGQTPGYSDAPRSDVASAGASVLPGSGLPTAADGMIRTAFLGDDYTLGTGASSKAKSWTTLVSDALGLDPVVVGDNGAGYAKPAQDGRIYADLVDRVVAAKPTLVVVSGGRNDVVDDVATLDEAATTLFAELRNRLPDATIVAVAPLWGDSAHPAKLTPVDNAVQAGVRLANGSYLDIQDPLHGHPKWMADDAHPNDKGYAAIADAVSSALRSHLR
ncbi:MAG: SGNH/GDSL hydrolase family protein [Jatrophihabitantaceae bacterium]